MLWWAISIALALLWGCWLLRHASETVSTFVRRASHGRAVIDGDGEFGLYAVCTSYHQAQLERIAKARAKRDDDPFEAAVLVPEHAEGEDASSVSVMIDSIEVARLDQKQSLDLKRVLMGAGFADATCLAQIMGPDRSGQFGVRLNARKPFVIAAADIPSSD